MLTFDILVLKIEFLTVPKPSEISVIPFSLLFVFLFDAKVI